MNASIAPIKSQWMVKVTFDMADAARDFAARLTKIRDQGTTPLFTASLLSSIERIDHVDIEKVESPAPPAA